MMNYYIIIIMAPKLLLSSYSPRVVSLRSVSWKSLVSSFLIALSILVLAPSTLALGDADAAGV